jgi:hypothetical protein
LACLIVQMILYTVVEWLDAMLPESA